MTNHPTHLIDPSSVKVAGLNARFDGGQYSGVITLDETPPRLRQLFEQYEEIVEGQILSLLDDIEEKIGAALIRVVFADGTVARVCDLQVYPSTGAVSFTAPQLAAAQ